MNKFTSWMQQANQFMFMVVVASLPFPRNITQWCWIVWAITWLLELRWLDPKNIQWGKQMIPTLFLFGWVIWEAVSLLWAQDIGSGGRFPDYHISLLFLPIIALFGFNEYYDWKKIAKVFIIACVCSFFLYCWLLYWMTNYEYVIINNGFGRKIHFSLYYFEIYLSPIKHRMIYCSALGTAIILLFLIRQDLIAERGKIKAYLFFFGSLAILLLAILATGSRANLLTLIALGTIAWVSQIKRHRPFIITALTAVGILGCLAVWKFHPRMQNLTIDQVTHIKDHYYDLDMQPRILIWHFALQNPEDYIVAGVGAGNRVNYLAPKFDQVNLPALYSQHFAPHNQYLSVCIELGLVAMLLFTFFWYYIPFCYPKGSKARQFALFFVLLLGINMLTDDNLYRIEPVICTCACLLLMNMMAKQENNPAA